MFMTELPKYYDTLGVTPTANLKEIKTNYRALAKRHHSDKVGGNDEFMKQLNEAYNVLSDHDKREEYDFLLECEYLDKWEQAYQKKQRALKKQQQEEERLKKFFQDPDADFTHLSKEEQREIAEKYRRSLYSWNHRDEIPDDIKYHPMLSPKTVKSYHKYRSSYGKELFDRPEPLKRLKKYLTNATRAYQAYQTTGLDLMMDLAQPIYGIGNLLMAALFVCCFAVTLCFSPIAIPLISLAKYYQGNYHSFYKLGSGALGFLKSHLKSIASFSLLGLAQLFTTPVTWLIIAPLRSIITLRKGSETIEKSPNIQRIIKEAEKGLAQGDKMILRVTTALLHEKFTNALEYKKRHASQSDKDEFQVFYEGVEKEFQLSTLNPQSSKPITDKQKNAVQNYLNFFKLHDEPSLLNATQPLNDRSFSGLNLD